MKYLTVFIVCIAAIAKSKSEKVSSLTVDDFFQDADRIENRIINGNYALPGQLPWQVAINVTTALGATLCGGALIDERWVLTAATCTKFAQGYSISMGSIYRGQALEEGLVIMKTNTSIVHQNYSEITRNNNIALLKLNEAVTFTEKIKKIELANASDYLGALVPVLVSGWGLSVTSNSTVNISSTLKYANLTTVSNDFCLYHFGKDIVTNRTLCALGDNFRGPCNGDDGSPLIKTNAKGQAVHVGILSFISGPGPAGCLKGIPSGYIRTASYRDWISQQMNGGGGGGGGGNGNGSNTLYNVNAWLILFITAFTQASFF